MASFLPNIPDYIPQIQPYQPDYNFLNNVLQTKQNKYDQNYKAISETYGNLLNSPMLRKDNIEKRNQFFNVINNDIKRLSGLDLSLQQNADAANALFDTFLQNKDMVHDMTYTKRYQSELRRAEEYKNCLDQSKCGGYYWEPGVQALNYQAQEYMNAAPGDAMTMQPGSYVPQVNIQEKVKNYAKELFATKGGGFGVQTVTPSPDGRYRVTLTNGQNLIVPLQQLINNEFGKDQAIIDMFKTQAYVDRKSFIQNNSQRFGSEEVAENEYFKAVENENLGYIRDQADYTQNLRNEAKAKMDAYAAQIKKRGVTGPDDPLTKAYNAAVIDYTAADKAANNSDESLRTAVAAVEAGADLRTRRSRVDSFYANALMHKQLNDSAKAVAAATGSVEIKADEYKEKAFAHELDMRKLSAQYSYMDRNNRNNAMYQLTKDQLLEDYKAQMEIAKKGTLLGNFNKPTLFENFPGSASGEDKTNENLEERNLMAGYAHELEMAQVEYPAQYANALQATANSDSKDNVLAQTSLKNVFGKNYNADKNVFVDDKGKEYSSAKDFLNAADYATQKKFYVASVDDVKAKNQLPLYSSFEKNGGKQLRETYNRASLTIQAASNTFRENNKVVKTNGINQLKEDTDDLMAFESLFDSQNNLRNKDQFAKEYRNKYYSANLEEPDADDINDAWEDANKNYTKLYNQFPTGMKAIMGTGMFGYKGGGRAAGNGYTFAYSANVPAAMGTRGLLGIIDDGLASGMIGTGVPVEKKNFETSDAAIQALSALKAELMSGSLTEKERAQVASVITYADQALSDPKYAGAVIKIPQFIIDRYKGTKDEVTWADNEELQKNGVSVFFEKANAKNDFTKTFKMQPYDIIINNNDVNLNIDNGGELQIKKRNADGTVEVGGSLVTWTNENGKLVQSEEPWTHTFSAETGGQYLYDGLNSYLEKIKANNDAFRSTGRLIYNLDDVDNMIQDLKSATGDVRESKPRMKSFNEQLQYNVGNF